jgi:hypothetical protein
MRQGNDNSTIAREIVDALSNPDRWRRLRDYSVAGDLRRARTRQGLRLVNLSYRQTQTAT